MERTKASVLQPLGDLERGHPEAAVAAAPPAGEIDGGGGGVGAFAANEGGPGLRGDGAPRDEEDRRGEEAAPRRRRRRARGPDDPAEDAVDAERLNRSLSDAVNYAFGVVAGEVWLLKDDGGGGEDGGGGGGGDGSLFRVRGGYYRRPCFEPPTVEGREALARLEDPSHPRHVPAPPSIPPGVGMVGTLFREAEWPSTASLGGAGGSAVDLVATAGGEEARTTVVCGGGCGATAGNGDGDGGGGGGGGNGGGLGGSGGARGTLNAPARSASHMGHPANDPPVLPMSSLRRRPPTEPDSPKRRLSATGRGLSLGSKLKPSRSFGGEGRGRSRRPQAAKPPWRDVASILADPDTAKAAPPRLAVMAGAGFGLALGVPFCFGASRAGGRRRTGIAVFLARPTADLGRLSSEENRAHLRAATDVAAAVLASVEARRAAAAAGREIAGGAFERFARRAAPASARVGGVDAFVENEGGGGRPGNGAGADGAEGGGPSLSSAPSSPPCGAVPAKAKIYCKKCQGGSLQIPPAPTYRESLWTMLGAFCGLLLLSAMDVQARKFTDGEVFLLIGPFGALMTLQYGLTSAPASQPRNMVLGQVVAGAVSLAFTYIPEELMSVWVRRAVGPAVAIATMVKLGVPHPPAGAHAVIYSEGKHNWTFYGLVVLGAIFSVIPGIIINNLSAKRQYPIFWSKWPPVLWERLMGGKKQDKTEPPYEKEH